MTTIHAWGKSYELENDMHDTAEWRLKCIRHSCMTMCSDSDRSFRYQSRNITLGTRENAEYKNKRKTCGLNLLVLYGVDPETIIFLNNANSKFCSNRPVRRVFLSRSWISPFFHLFSVDKTVVSVYTDQVLLFSLGNSIYEALRLKIRGIFENRIVYWPSGRRRSRKTSNRGRLEGINMFYVTDALVIVINVHYHVFFLPGVLLSNFGRPTF